MKDKIFFDGGQRSSMIDRDLSIQISIEPVKIISLFFIDVDVYYYVEIST